MKVVWFDCGFGIKWKSALRNLKSAMLLGALFFALSSSAAAQQQAKVPKIGQIRARPGVSPAGSSEIIRRMFRELGYVEGKNITFEYRYSEGKLDRFPALADELVRLKVDVLLTSSAEETLAAKNATKVIPIVFVGGSDPVAAGLVDSLARPGGTSRDSLALGRCSLASDWSCSRKPFPISPVLRCSGIRMIGALRNNGKKAYSRHES